MMPTSRTGTRLYEIWRHMKRRCEVADSKDYPGYGGRGIRVCDAWSHSFTAFCEWAWANGYTVDRSLDRIDVNGGYSPENCRWATYIEQQLNRRDTGLTYINVRLRADRMAVLLALLPEDAVTTLIVRRDKLAPGMAEYLGKHQDTDPPVEPHDAKRNEGRTRKRVPNFMDSFAGDF